MLFEKSVNPKVIQGLLGHKDVKTTIMNYNSVDKSYFDRISNLIKNSLNRFNIIWHILFIFVKKYVTIQLYEKC